MLIGYESNENCKTFVYIGPSGPKLHSVCIRFFLRLSPNKKIHKSQRVIEYIRNLYEEGVIVLEKSEFTEPAKCMPDEFKISDDVIACYREFYRKDKVRFAKWKHSKTPEWF